MQIKTIGRDRDQRRKQIRETRTVFLTPAGKSANANEKRATKSHTLINQTGGSGEESRTKWEEIL